MSQGTNSEWTDASWNPVRGCSRVSEGCRNCYAERQSSRFIGAGQYAEGFAERTKAGPRWTGRVELIPSKLDEPIHWRKPQRIFVNSMSDLFHESLNDEAIAAVFGVMAAAPQHTFQVLTKRPERMRAWFAAIESLADRAGRIFPFDSHDWRRGHVLSAASIRNGVSPVKAAFATQVADRGWPLPNVWLGVSVENQATADERIPLLLQTPAAVRFVSLEPCLGPVDLSRWLVGERANERGGASVSSVCGDRSVLDRRAGKDLETPSPNSRQSGRDSALLEGAGNETRRAVGVGRLSGAHRVALDWIIVGGESGPGARPFDIEWARSTVAQCKAAGVACFVKQLGAIPIIYRTEARRVAAAGGRIEWDDSGEQTSARLVLRDRKGGDWNEWPEDFRVLEFPEIQPKEELEP